MAQKQAPIPPGEGPKKDGDNLMQRKLPLKPNTSATLSKLDAMIEEETKNKRKIKPLTPQCCGRLPCKGRTPFCFQCDICMDCITGAGCGHDTSSHKFSQMDDTGEEES